MFHTKVPHRYGRSWIWVQSASWNSAWYSSGCQSESGTGLGGFSWCWTTLAPAPYSLIAIRRVGWVLCRVSAHPAEALDGAEDQPGDPVWPTTSVCPARPLVTGPWCAYAENRSGSSVRTVPARLSSRALVAASSTPCSLPTPQNTIEGWL